MKLKVKILKFLAGKPVCMINNKTAEEMGIYIDNRVSIRKNKKKLISIIDFSEVLNKNEIAVSNEIVKNLRLKTGEEVDVEVAEMPGSVDLIKKKLRGQELTKEEVREIIKDIAGNELTEAEIAFFISAIYERDMSLRETKDLISAMIESGSKLRLRGKVADKHSIGGVAGNRTTPIVISICTTTGLVMPKTSSRAITSAAGTADTIETLAKVDFSVREIKQILKKTKACFVWGGTLGLAPADDKIIKVGRVIKIDPTAQLLASILSKKISVDSKYVLIDIPFGKSAKVSKRQAEKLKAKFLSLGKKFDIKLEVVMTDGSHPIGDGVGPILEMRDVIKVLKRDKDAPKDLEEKSIMLSGKILEMTEKAKPGKGHELAKQILDSGKAWIKFQEIIKAQQGKIKRLNPGKYKYTVRAHKNGKISHISNNLINNLARAAGCPEDKAAGIYFYKKLDNVKKGEKIFTLFATSEEKLEYAKKFYNQNKKEIIVFS
ncbi:MAG: thymidine phosphorylase family protein [Candidatus Nanoarchaeia archaeon]|nr:thymidine phosphorylase family protein [Candidatus Nanoarchaeia archaeon]MDD5740836.1 thymidine phosphorylase family protein [Candidatus Nanoarchaeia archaeon]